MAGVLPSVFQVVTDTGLGTAFYIGNNEFLTAAHVVAGAAVEGIAYAIAQSSFPEAMARERDLGLEEVAQRVATILCPCG